MGSSAIGLANTRGSSNFGSFESEPLALESPIALEHISGRLTESTLLK